MICTPVSSFVTAKPSCFKSMRSWVSTVLPLVVMETVFPTKSFKLLIPESFPTINKEPPLIEPLITRISLLLILNGQRIYFFQLFIMLDCQQ